MRASRVSSLSNKFIVLKKPVKFTYTPRDAFSKIRPGGLGEMFEFFDRYGYVGEKVKDRGITPLLSCARSASMVASGIASFLSFTLTRPIWLTAAGRDSMPSDMVSAIMTIDRLSVFVHSHVIVSKAFTHPSKLATRSSSPRAQFFLR